MNKNVLRLVESAVLIAIGVVLSTIAIGDGIWLKGGSITVASMLPIVIISFRHGKRWGVFTGVVFGIIQAILGAKNFGYAPNVLVWIAILLLDYIIPFGAIGLSSLFNNKFTDNKKVYAIVLGICFTFTLRFICHFVSGWIVWDALFPNGKYLSVVYSFLYNISYMLPETIITAIIASILYFPTKKYWDRKF